MLVEYCTVLDSFELRGYYQTDSEDLKKFFKYMPENVWFVGVYVPEFHEFWHWSKKYGWQKANHRTVEYIFDKKNKPEG